MLLLRLLKGKFVRFEFGGFVGDGKKNCGWGIPAGLAQAETPPPYLETGKIE